MTHSIIECPPVILAWRRDEATMKILDTLNWWRMPLAAVGESLGLPKLPMPAADASREEWDTYCKRDVEVIRTVVHAWWTFLQTYDLGGFAATIASQAFRAYRHRFMRHPILIDTHPHALALSRSAIFGGRTEAFFIGRKSGPIYAYDVNSMYPHVMRKHSYPAIKKSYLRRLELLELEDWLTRYQITARVVVRTDEPAYPMRYNKKLVFPIGQFETSLTTPDLLYALKRGHLVSCSEVALYESAPLFREFVDEIYALRLKAKDRGNEVDSWLLKKLMNSLYGKFAQRGQVWEISGDDLTHQVRVWEEYDYDTGDHYSMRSYAGIIQRKMKESEALESHPAIAAHVTAYARAHLRDLLMTAGRDQTLYCDTDSLYVTELGSRRLAEHVDARKLGGLKLEATYEWFEVRGLKDYASPKVDRCKGVKKNARWIAPDRVEQEQWTTLKGLFAVGDLSAPRTKKIEKHLGRVYSKGIVRADGRVDPLELPDA